MRKSALFATVMYGYCQPRRTLVLLWVGRERQSAFHFDNFSTLQAFDSKADLQQHQQQHMREAKPYKCTHCVKTFANSSYLSQHMRIHLNIKPFGPCQYCGRKVRHLALLLQSHCISLQFTQLSHLQQHLRTHTGEKPYKCKVG